MQNQANTGVTLHVCITCRRGEEPLEPKEERSGYKMRLALADVMEKGWPAGIELKPVECLSGCKRGCTVALAAPGKWSYVVADLDPELHAPDILTFAVQYAAHPEGVPLWRERPEIVKRSVLARVPPAFLPIVGEETAA
jgi:predicted metal-binding protein